MSLRYTITHGSSTYTSERPANPLIISNGSTTSTITTATTRTLSCGSKILPNDLIIGSKKLNCAGKFCVGDISITTSTYYDYLCFTANTAGSKVSMSVSLGSGSSVSRTIEYSTDLSSWATFVSSTHTTPEEVELLNVGDKVYFRGSNGNGLSYYGDSDDKTTYFEVYTFTGTGSLSASGSVMSLIDGNGSSTTIPVAYCFTRLFSGMTSLTTAPSLPATTLLSYCYYYMFNGCTSLTTPPALPATSLYDVYTSYQKMFYNCSSLQVSDTQTSDAPYKWRIPAYSYVTTAGGYEAYSMFEGCAGTRSTNSPTFSYANVNIYYTNNPPSRLKTDLPTAQEAILTDLGNGTKPYRVLEVDGTRAKLFTLYDIATNQNWDDYTPNNYPPEYEGSLIDTLLNTTFYNSLSSTAKAAITPITFYQDVYDSGSYVSQRTVGSRYVYALNYREITSLVSTTSYDIVNLLFDEDLYNGTSSTIWLAEANESVAGSSILCRAGMIYGSHSWGEPDEYVASVRGAFWIDLTKISWDYQ